MFRVRLYTRLKPEEERFCKIIERNVFKFSSIIIYTYFFFFSLIYTKYRYTKYSIYSYKLILNR